MSQTKNQDLIAKFVSTKRNGIFKIKLLPMKKPQKTSGNVSLDSLIRSDLFFFTEL